MYSVARFHKPSSQTRPKLTGGMKVHQGMVQPVVRHNSALTQTEFKFDRGVIEISLSFSGVKRQIRTSFKVVLSYIIFDFEA